MNNKNKCRFTYGPQVSPKSAHLHSPSPDRKSANRI